MLLDIRHVTRYHYEHPVRESVMELRMQPQKSVRQRLISFDLDLDPRAQLFSYIDPFGNAVHHFDVPQPHDELTIVARATVETQEPPELPQGLDLGEWDRLKSSFTQAECFDFLQPHGFAAKTDALAEFMTAKGLDRPNLRDPLTGLRQLNETIYSAFDYEQGVTRADSPIDESLARGAGVCQDFAHIMIAICRDWGLPSRYVSGYLFTDRKKGDRSDPDATHAWVEVFLPSHRWVGFDPTNNTLTGEAPRGGSHGPRLQRRAALSRGLQGRQRQPVGGRCGSFQGQVGPGRAGVLPYAQADIPGRAAAGRRCLPRGTAATAAAVSLPIG